MSRIKVPKRISIRRIFLELEINFEIMDSEGYVCRLVPGERGFELSRLDQCLGNDVPETLITAIGDHILKRDA